jgi:cell division septation protein DedD
MFFLPGLLYTAYAEKRFYSIQVGAVRNLDDAVNMTDSLKRGGHDVFYRYEKIKGKGKWYRVYIERFGSKEDAEKK